MAAADIRTGAEPRLRVDAELHARVVGKLIGKDNKTVVRGGFARNYYDEGTNFFSSLPGNNPGQQQSLDPRPGVAPGFSPGGLTLQSALPPYVAFPSAYTNTFSQADFTFSNGFSTMKDDLRTPYVQSWNIGVQREIGPHAVVEALSRQSNLPRLADLQPQRSGIFKNGSCGTSRRAEEPRVNLANGAPVRQQRAGEVVRCRCSKPRSARADPAGALPRDRITNATFITTCGDDGTLATFSAISAG